MGLRPLEICLILQCGEPRLNNSVLSYQCFVIAELAKYSVNNNKNGFICDDINAMNNEKKQSLPIVPGT